MCVCVYRCWTLDIQEGPVQRLKRKGKKRAQKTMFVTDMASWHQSSLVMAESLICSRRIHYSLMSHLKSKNAHTIITSLFILRAVKGGRDFQVVLTEERPHWQLESPLLKCLVSGFVTVLSAPVQLRRRPQASLPRAPHA